MNDLQIIENALYGYIPKGLKYEKNLVDSIEYSLKAGGKRIRPKLVLEFSRLCGGSDKSALPFACAIEMIHTYSLIHDDLPCMDNDDMRRGKPSNHKVFGEDIALLAGDALQSLAFDVMSQSSTLENASAEACVRCINILSSYCGTVGMVGGQVIDLENENKIADLSSVTECNRKKTGALIKAACEMGCVCAGADEEKILAARKFGENIGIAFQIVDDILDVTSSDEELGKPVGSDIDNNKSTYVSLLGVDECKKRVDKLTKDAIDALDCFDGNTSSLKQLALNLSNRKN
ncbi:MAG: polyprenyl synthetase family protein [Ruminococcus sp.]|nr:polyprenyl synthetase family protein [Ruminococcus sp.]